MLGFLFLGWIWKQNGGPVTSLEDVTVNPVSEKRQQRGEEQDINKKQKQTGLDKPEYCDLKYNQENNRDKTATSNILNWATVCSFKTNSNNQTIQLSSTHL